MKVNIYKSYTCSVCGVVFNDEDACKKHEASCTNKQVSAVNVNLTFDGTSTPWVLVGSLAYKTHEKVLWRVREIPSDSDDDGVIDIFGWGVSIPTKISQEAQEPAVINADYVDKALNLLVKAASEYFTKMQNDMMEAVQNYKDKRDKK